MKIYPSLRLLWAALVVSAVTGLGSLFPENPALSFVPNLH